MIMVYIIIIVIISYFWRLFFAGVIFKILSQRKKANSNDPKALSRAFKAKNKQTNKIKQGSLACIRTRFFTMLVFDSHMNTKFDNDFVLL